MIPDYLVDTLQRYSSAYFLYPWNLFELRLQEEMVRSDRSGSPFYYVELPFSSVSTRWVVPGHARRFWEVLLRTMESAARGSDIKGFLEDEKGLGIVLLDSGPEGWQEFYSRLCLAIKTDATELEGHLEQWVSELPRFHYPDCVRNENEAPA